MKFIAGLLLSSLFVQVCYSQETETDTAKLLEPVIIRAFEQNRSAALSTATVRVLAVNSDKFHNNTSLVSAFNTVAGVRMEERSPGSYRINIRGSSLRSPFGVRNVKVYYNGIPVTDPGGNTYFNQFALNNFHSIEINKGTASSLYGAGTGGLILVNSIEKSKPGFDLYYNTGSFSLHNLLGTVRFGNDDLSSRVSYAHNETDGYRVQTQMRRDNFSWVTQARLNQKHSLTASLLFTDMYYQTPGALTAAEFAADPKRARPAGGGFPSAVNAKAAIFQKNLLAGFTSRYQIDSFFSNTTTLYGAFAQIKNSAIRNFERRNEPHFGGRTVFTYKRKIEQLEWQFVAGSEFQQGYFNTMVSNNRNGQPDTMQTNDDVSNRNLGVFLQADLIVREKLSISIGAGVNSSSVSFARLNRYPVLTQKRTYRNELAPRIAVLRRFENGFSARATVAKGYSPPTVAEILPSTGVISTDLEAEQGWNYELMFRQELLGRKLSIELTGFYFRLNDALVQRRDLSGADFFVNAGNVNQKGAEMTVQYVHIARRLSRLDYYLLRADYTYNHFRYGSFVKGVDNFSGRMVPSVPTGTLSVSADVMMKAGFYLNANYYAATKIFLNDANTAFAGAYHLLGGRIGWKKTSKKWRPGIFAGADNLLDENYSLGNDINAAGNRFFNAAPGRNWFAGLSLGRN
ncbi:MAG: TonB-dependent receptor plug domain-containing protein [Gemmatimonadaceae bacterium]|nr:TonB-dependent receptor plug domain-containing protein [Chitinophagaceae bacterium]